jgi:hypothetical protein
VEQVDNLKQLFDQVKYWLTDGCPQHGQPGAPDAPQQVTLRVGSIRPVPAKFGVECSAND